MRRAREFEIIDRYFRRSGDAPDLTVGIGDDAAVVDVAGPIAVAVDMLVAGTHFPETLSAHAIGHRALAVNLSDMAAMGATPRWITLALSLPDIDPVWLESFSRGLFELAARHGVGLIGGDTTRGPLTVTVQIIGLQAKPPIQRTGGLPGDRIFVSGTLGDSAAGLAGLETPPGDRSASMEALIRRFSYPEPRVSLGLAIADLAHAGIDVSDGLVNDLAHICEGSGCGAVLDLECLPLSSALRAGFAPEQATQFALYGGDDYELCFTVPESAADKVRAIDVGTPVTEIGRLTAEPGMRAISDGKERALEPGGFEHFD